MCTMAEFTKLQGRIFRNTSLKRDTHSLSLGLTVVVQREGGERHASKANKQRTKKKAN